MVKPSRRQQANGVINAIQGQIDPAAVLGDQPEVDQTFRQSPWTSIDAMNRRTPFESSLGPLVVTQSVQRYPQDVVSNECKRRSLGPGERSEHWHHDSNCLAPISGPRPKQGLEYKEALLLFLFTHQGMQIQEPCGGSLEFSQPNPGLDVQRLEFESGSMLEVPLEESLSAAGDSAIVLTVEIAAKSRENVLFATRVHSASLLRGDHTSNPFHSFE
jgi:hypothetical protein